MSAASTPPQAVEAQVRWFSEALEIERADAADKARDTVELRDGVRTHTNTDGSAKYRFEVVTGDVASGDASGRLVYAGEFYPAEITEVDLDMVEFEIQKPGELPAHVDRASFSTSDTFVLDSLITNVRDLGEPSALVPPAAEYLFFPETQRSWLGGNAAAAVPDDVQADHAAVIEAALSRLVTYVWGPPGTGKTHCLARLVAAAVDLGLRVGVFSHTNVAVDGAILACCDAMGDDADALLRVGPVADQRVPDINRLEDRLRLQVPELFEERKTLRRERNRLRKHDPQSGEIATLEGRLNAIATELEELRTRELTLAAALFATLSKNHTLAGLRAQHYDLVIIDEVSIAMPPQLLLAAVRSRGGVVLVGDPCQLPPVVVSRHPYASARLGTDAFRLAGLMDGDRPADSPAVVSLRTQHRMRPGIADVARALIYGPGLADAPSVTSRPVPEHVGVALPSADVFVFDTSALETRSHKVTGSHVNVRAALAVARLAAQVASEAQVPAQGEPLPVAVVSPYRRQRALIQAAVRDLKVSDRVAVKTVHSFQGNEADVVIYDNVLAGARGGYYRVTLESFRSEELRLLNVAVTRARHRFVIAGDVAWLDDCALPGSALGDLWEHLSQDGGVARVCAAEFLGAPDGVEAVEPAKGWMLVVGDDRDTYAPALHRKGVARGGLRPGADGALGTDELARHGSAASVLGPVCVVDGSSVVLGGPGVPLLVHSGQRFANETVRLLATLDRSTNGLVKALRDSSAADND